MNLNLYHYPLLLAGRKVIVLFVKKEISHSFDFTRAICCLESLFNKGLKILPLGSAGRLLMVL